MAATTGYRNEEDVLGEFLTECCDINNTRRVRASDLFTAYRNWTGNKKVSQRAFGLAMKKRDFVNIKHRGFKWWEGVGIAEDPAEVV